MPKGFTLIEIFIIIIIILLLFSLALPISLNFYKRQQFQTYSQQILQTLRKAQSKAMAVEGDSNFGVYLDNANKKYILFKGDSYSSGDPENEEFDFPVIITVSGLSEVVFLKPEGRPSPSTGSITINSDSLTQTIGINAVGRINSEL